MRFALIVVAVACVACSTGPGFPPHSIAGSWSDETTQETPAGPETLALSQSGTAVTGSGAWAAAKYGITGQYVAPKITLTFVVVVNGQPVNNTTTVEMGTAIDENQIVLGGTTFHRVGN